MKRLATATALSLFLPLAAQAQEAEVMHWWTAGTEAEALHELSSAYEENGGTWVDRAVPDFDSALAASMNSIMTGDAPLALQFAAGSQFVELAQAGLLTDLTPYAERDGWADQISPAMTDLISDDGKIYALPVTLQNQFWMFRSTEAYEKAGLEAPKSWDDFLASLSTFEEAGIVPVAQGADAWQDIILMEAVLLYGGYDGMFQKVFGGDIDAIESDEFIEAATDLRTIADHLDPGAASRKWNDATAMVVNGDAAVQFMGDWAKAEFANAGLVAGEDYACDLGVPGNAYYVALTDVFVMPENDDKIDGQSLFAKTVMDPETQVAFNMKKGGLPVRADAEMEPTDACAAKAMKHIQEGKPQRTAPSMWMSADRYGAYGDVISQYIRTPDMSPEAFAQSLVSAVQMTQ